LPHRNSALEFQQLFGVRPETRNGTNAVFDLETSRFSQGQEIKHLSKGVVLYAAQSNLQIDAEIAEKGRFRTKTN
jgi:hypothetical protein